MDQNQRNTIVQQRIKKMLENKKKNLHRESSQLTKRLKSNIGDKYATGEEEEDNIKPSSTKRMRRPISAMRQVQPSNTANVVLQQQHQEIDVHAIISSVFQYGVKIKDICKQKKLNKQQWCDRLVSDNIFMLRVGGYLKKHGQEQWSQIVQALSKERIIKLIERNELLKRCCQCEQKIHIMIEQRLKTLSKH